MRALLIGPEERSKIAAMVEKARANPVSWESMKDAAIAGSSPILAMKDRKPNTVRPASEHIVLPQGYHVAFSFEYQPAGLFRHLSVSVEAEPGKTPSPEAVEMIAAEFGFNSFPPLVGRIWLEEFGPGRLAANVIELVTQEAGHA